MDSGRVKMVNVFGGYTVCKGIDTPGTDIRSFCLRPLTPHFSQRQPTALSITLHYNSYSPSLLISLTPFLSLFHPTQINLEYHTQIV